MGANRKEDSGLYFSWGNTEGHTEGSGYDFSQETYDATPAAAITANLSLDQDAARANLGAPWRMPNETDLEELVDNCTSVWTTRNGVNGQLFTSKVNGNTLFIPASGRYDGTTLRNGGNNGDYWLSTYNSIGKANRLLFDETNVYTRNSANRYLGFPVRAVLDL